MLAMLSRRGMAVPLGSLQACGSAVVAHEDRQHEVTHAAVDGAAFLDVGQPVACVGGGGERACEHVVDRDHTGARSHAQETSIPSCIARENHVLLPAFAPYRVPMLEKNAILWMLPVTTILLPSAAMRHSTLYNYVIHVPTIKTTIP